VNIKSHVKTGDTVLVLTGKDAGKKGKVLDVLPKEGKVLVEGVNIRTIHKKPRGMNQEGGRIEYRKLFANRYRMRSKRGADDRAVRRKD
jgi:ribosomal protein L24